MKTIWKYTFEASMAVQLKWIPSGAKPLYVGVQDHMIYLWAEVDQTQPKIEVVFQVYETGQPIAEGNRYVGTTQIGPFVWHLYTVEQLKLDR